MTYDDYSTFIHQKGRTVKHAKKENTTEKQIGNNRDY